MIKLETQNVKKLELAGEEIIYELKRLSEEIDYSITINKKSKIIKGLQDVFNNQRKKFNFVISKIEEINKKNTFSIQALDTLKDNLYNEYSKFLDHIIFLKEKGNVLDNIRIFFNKTISGVEPLKSDVSMVKNYEIYLSHLFRKNFDLRKKYVITKARSTEIIIKLAKITKYVENDRTISHEHALEIEYLNNLIFRYLTLLQ